jgi:cellobiose-specific phosphotransferase system component IIC
MIGVIEQSITPLAGKLGQQKYVIAIRDGFTAALPFMIIGSFMLVFIFPPFSPKRPTLCPRLAGFFYRISRAADVAFQPQHGRDDLLHLGRYWGEPGPSV